MTYFVCWLLNLLLYPGIIGHKKPSHLYLEGHLGAHIQSSILGDPDTQEVIKNRRVHEQQWANKSSTTVKCQARKCLSSIVFICAEKIKVNLGQP
jgi:hypothetical protein